MKTTVLEEMPALFWQQLTQDDLRQWFVPAVDYTAEIAIIRTKTQFDREMIDRFSNLKLIIRAGSGFDNIAVRYAEQKNIAVCNTPQANAFSAYEHTLAQILALIKNLQLGKKEIQIQRWKSEHPDNWEIADLKVLVVGLGRVGSRVAQALKFLGAEVKAVDPYLTPQQWKNQAVEPIHYIEGLKWCNLLTFHCPLYSDIISYSRFRSICPLNNFINYFFMI
ncbi:MAG: NAD(P)-dependent oxidoreductase [Candidatus Cloacimonadales bacterium]